MASQKYTTLGQGTLSSGYTAAATTLVLNTGQGATFPSSGDFVVALNDPPAFFLKCTSRSGDTLTVATVAVDGTTASNQAIGVTVTEVITASVLDGLRGDMSAYGAAASLPVTTEAHKGDQYQCSDAPMRFVYDGTVWQPLGPIFPLTLPVLSSFTGLTTTATTTDTSAGITISGSNNTISTYYKSGPGSTPFSATLGVMALIGPEDFGQVMILGRESSSGKQLQYGVQHNGTTGLQILVNKINGDGSFNAQYVTKNWQQMSFMGGLIFLRIKDDGTNRLCQVSVDAVVWQTIHSVGRTDFLTCNQFGWSVQGSTNWPPCARILHWAQG
jgi:hypothetical protein